VNNMKDNNITSKSCLEMQELFSPWLDGEIAPGESDLLARHLQICPACRDELEVWQALSESVKELSFEPNPPPDFTAQVISRLKVEQPDRKKRWSFIARHKTFAAAAAIMLFAGSMGIANNLMPAEQAGPEIAEVSRHADPPAVIDNNKNNEPETQANKPADNVADAGNDNNSNNNDGKGNTAVTPDTGTPGAAVNNTASPAAADPDKSGAEEKVVVDPELALLGNDITIKSTLIKMSADNPAGAVDKAESMASGSGGASQLITKQNATERSLSVISLTVPENKSGDLMNSLTALGQVVDKSDEVQDITYIYKEKLARQQELATMLNKPEENEKAKYRAEYNSLNKQLLEWKEQSTNHTIMLWVEKGQGN
jgi:hypothetical protein